MTGRRLTLKLSTAQMSLLYWKLIPFLFQILISKVDNPLAQWSETRFHSKQSLLQQGSLISVFKEVEPWFNVQMRSNTQETQWLMETVMLSRDVHATFNSRPLILSKTSFYTNTICMALVEGNDRLSVNQLGPHWNIWLYILLLLDIFAVGLSRYQAFTIVVERILNNEKRNAFSFLKEN